MERQQKPKSRPEGVVSGPMDRGDEGADRELWVAGGGGEESTWKSAGWWMRVDRR